mgnify:CR=1 FL=1
MKKINRILSVIALSALTLSFHSCKDYLTEQAPGQTTLNDYFTSTAAAVQTVTAAYTPLMWEFNETYCCEWFIGDIASDDALKGGGSTSDMADVFDIENWRTTSQNTLLKDFYRAQYQGIARANLAIQYISAMEVGLDDDFTQAMKNRLLGEAYFLRAYYYFRLVRIFAGVPLVTTVVDNSDSWPVERASVETIFNQILSDMEQANKLLPVKSSSLYTSEDLGRATKGAAQAMLMKVNLYMASPFWRGQDEATRTGITKSETDCYSDAKMWGDSIITSGEYDLCPNYEDNFTLAGENGIESVFEIQYADVLWGSYAGENDPIHFGYTAGSFTQTLVRSRSTLIGSGWGFNHPTWDLYNEFEALDSIRRAAAIINPYDPTWIESVTGDPTSVLVQNVAEEGYLGNFLLNNKYGLYRAEEGGGYGVRPYTHDSRGPLNNRQIRYADVLLMHAEACLKTGDVGSAKTDINRVRSRVGLGDVEATEASLRHERRCELAMEGHRWFDLVRWEGVDGNGLKAHMDAYKANESAEVQGQINEFIAGKHELFPIPNEEISLNPTNTPMQQNPQY